MIRKIAWLLLFLFVIINLVAYNHAYRFTHFSTSEEERTADPKSLSLPQKLQVLFLGISNPKPAHKSVPAVPYETVSVVSDVTLEAWRIPSAPSRGTIILFHGYSGEKSSLIGRAMEFRKLGYTTFLVDFIGSGGSEGSKTTIGFHESREVRDVFEAVRQSGEKNIHLFGTSMGAAAILKAMNDYSLDVSSLILECPFGSLYKTVGARFRMMGVPEHPLSAILTFWGGMQHSYWAFGHNPSEYASSVDVPVLLLFGEKDDRVSMEETRAIYSNLKGEKTLKIYPEEGHNFYTPENEKQWAQDVKSFLNKYGRNKRK